MWLSTCVCLLSLFFERSADFFHGVDEQPLYADVTDWLEQMLEEKVSTSLTEQTNEDWKELNSFLML